MLNHVSSMWYYLASWANIHILVLVILEQWFIEYAFLLWARGIGLRHQGCCSQVLSGLNIFLALTALNLLPLVATTASVNIFIWRHNSTNWRHAFLIPLPLSFLKSAMVLKSGIRRSSNHIVLTLRFPLQPAWRLHTIQVAINVELQHGGGMIPCATCVFRRDLVEPQRC